MCNSKSEKFKSIVDTCFSLVSKHGIDAVTISLVSKYSGVSRGWIYKYAGENIEEVLKFSLNEYANEFSNLSGLKIYSNENELIQYISDYTLKMIKNIERSPSILTMYFSEHDNDNMIGQIIRDVEGKSISILAKSIKNCFNLDLFDATLLAEKIIFMRMGNLMLFFSKRKFAYDLQWEEKFIDGLLDDLKRILIS